MCFYSTFRWISGWFKYFILFFNFVVPEKTLHFQHVELLHSATLSHATLCYDGHFDEFRTLALKFAFVSSMSLSWIRINERLDWSRMFYSQLAVDSHSVCGDPDSVLRVQGGCARWPTGCLSSTCKPTTIALSTLSETHSGTAAEALTVHEQQVQTYSAEVPPLSSGTHLLGNLQQVHVRTNQSIIHKILHHP